MAKEKAGGGIRILSKTNTVMMTIKDIGREGDRLIITGSILEAWPSKML